jgi:hypothetical protein
LGDPAAQIHRLLVASAKSLAISQTQVYYIYNQFKGGTRETCQDLPLEGRPVTVNTEVMQEQLKNLLYEDNNWGTENYAHVLGISSSTVKCMLKEMGAKKIAARWVPHELNPAQKVSRVKICEEHLKRYKADPEMLKRIIAIDETWVRSYDPRDRESSKQWRLPEQEP